MKNPLSQFLDGVRSRMARFSDAPVLVAAAKSQTPAPVMAALEPWVPTRITAKDFDAAGPFNADQWSTLAEFEVPTENTFKILTGAPFDMYLKAKKVRAGANAAAANRSITAPGILPTSARVPALPTKVHPVVSVWGKVAGVWSRLTVTAINFSTETINYDEPANCTDIELYYVHGVGAVRIRAYRKLGDSDTQATLLWNSSLGAIHSVDQKDSEVKGNKWLREITVTDDFTLGLEVNSSLVHSFEPRADMVIDIPAFSREVRTLDSTRKAQIAEIDLRGGI